MLSVFFELFFQWKLDYIKPFFLCSILFPFISSFFLAFRSFFICRYDIPELFGLLLIWSSFEMSFVLFDFFKKAELTCFIIKGPLWFSFTGSKIYWSFLLDEITLIMMMVVTLISFLVHFYSVGYMHRDPKFQLFFSYLSLFTFFMLILISSANLIQLFIGWEGVGLCSFLLISFWNERIAANKAALKAMIVNKFGDYFLLFGFILLVFYFQTLSFSELLSFLNWTTVAPIDSILFKKIYILGSQYFLISVIAFFLFLGIMTKSAQFGFHTWLPDAMEGPTPVSALIHAATMVTAGVFLFIRFHFFFFWASDIDFFIIFIGTLTTFFSATVALVQNDIKKIIAYSTCSQLGYMITACGFHLYGYAFFHLVMHAFFKALLFLGAGSVIHAMSDEQDIRKMGGLAFKLPVTFFCMLIASISLAGFPFLAGFYSKEIILETLFSIGTPAAKFAYFFGIFSIFLTCVYSARLLFLVFFCRPNGNLCFYKKMHSTSIFILIPLIILSFLSIFCGFYSKKVFITLNLNYMYMEDILSSSLFFNFLPFGLIFFGFFFSYLFFLSKYRFYFSFFFNNHYLKRFYMFLNKKWFVDSFYNHFITSFFFTHAFSFNYNSVEKGWIEVLGPTGVSNLFFWVSLKLNFLHSKSVKFYVFFFCLIFCLFCLFGDIFTLF